MDVVIFGKDGCARCKSTKNKVTHLLGKWGLKESVGLRFVDMETVDGLAEGSFRDVFEIPVTIVDLEGRQMARWDGIVPNSQDLRVSLEDQARAAAS